MKRIMILLMLVSLSLFAKNEKSEKVLIAELKNLTEEQKEVLAFSVIYGEQHNVRLTLPAISWREATLRMGANNPKEGKYGTWGTYQATMEDALNRYHMKPTPANIAKLKKLLLTDLNFAAQDAVIELNAWNQRHVTNGKSNVWRNTVAAYNVGTRAYKSREGKEYVTDIIKRMKMLDAYLAKNPDFLASAKEKYKIEERLKTKKVYFGVETASLEATSVDSLATLDSTTLFKTMLYVRRNYKTTVS